MQFGSVCSGIEAASVAWHPIGWKAAWLAEIEPFPCAVLAHHYPSVPNLGDMTTIARRVLTGEVSAPDVFCGGTPCQAFSVAGLRQSLDDARGNLTLKFVEIANAIDLVRAGRGEDECIVFWENVPGVLSTKDNAFGCFLAGLAGENDPLEPPGGKWTNAGCVSGPQRTVAWRVLDAQYFGVAQRRRRVFVVASARKGFDPANVLFEWDGVRRDTAPSREARQTAPTIPSRSTAGGGLGTDFDCDGGTICVATGQAGAEIGAEMAPTLNCNHEAPYVAHSLRGEGFDASEDGTGRCTPLVPVAMINMQGSKGNAVAQADGPSFTLNAMHGHDMHAVAVPVGVTIHGTDPTVQKVASYSEDGTGRGTPLVPMFLHTNKGRPDGRRSAHTEMVSVKEVRRLTPVECEKLQGFEPGYTDIPWTEYQRIQRRAEKVGTSFEAELRKHGKVLRGPNVPECPDGPRYKALGNSWAIPCVSWIGKRIQVEVDRG